MHLASRPMAHALCFIVLHASLLLCFFLHLMRHVLCFVSRHASHMSHASYLILCASCLILHLMPYISHPMPYMSHLMPYTSCLTPHVLHLTPHALHPTSSSRPIQTRGKGTIANIKPRRISAHSPRQTDQSKARTRIQ